MNWTTNIHTFPKRAWEALSQNRMLLFSPRFWCAVSFWGAHFQEHYRGKRPDAGKPAGGLCHRPHGPAGTDHVSQFTFVGASLCAGAVFPGSQCGRGTADSLCIGVSRVGARHGAWISVRSKRSQGYRVFRAADYPARHCIFHSDHSIL